MPQYISGEFLCKARFVAVTSHWLTFLICYGQQRSDGAPGLAQAIHIAGRLTRTLRVASLAVPGTGGQGGFRWPIWQIAVGTDWSQRDEGPGRSAADTLVYADTSEEESYVRSKRVHRPPFWRGGLE